MLGFNKWIHVDFFFYSDSKIAYLSNDSQFMFEELIRKILLKTRLFVRRKFYLYEPQPNAFLALETRHIIFIPIIGFIVYMLGKRYPFIRYANIHSVGGEDENNGEGFCNIMNSMTEYYLFQNKNKLSHIIHCILEFQLQSRGKEIDFYKKMIKDYDLPDAIKKLIKKGGKVLT